MTAWHKAARLQDRVQDHCRYVKQERRYDMGAQAAPLPVVVTGASTLRVGHVRFLIEVVPVLKQVTQVLRLSLSL